MRRVYRASRPFIAQRSKRMLKWHMLIRSTKPSFIVVRGRKGASRLRRQRFTPSFNACPSRRTDVCGTGSGRTRSSALLRKMSFPIVSERRGAVPVRNERQRLTSRDDFVVRLCEGCPREPFKEEESFHGSQCRFAARFPEY